MIPSTKAARPKPTSAADCGRAVRSLLHLWPAGLVRGSRSRRRRSSSARSPSRRWGGVSILFRRSPSLNMEKKREITTALPAALRKRGECAVPHTPASYPKLSSCQSGWGSRSRLLLFFSSPSSIVFFRARPTAARYTQTHTRHSPLKWINSQSGSPATRSRSAPAAQRATRTACSSRGRHRSRTAAEARAQCP